MSCITELPRHQQALLLTVLQSYQNLCETEITKGIIHGQDTMITALTKYSLDNTKQLIQTLFGEINVQGIEFIQHFAAEHPQFQAITIAEAK